MHFTGSLYRHSDYSSKYKFSSLSQVSPAKSKITRYQQTITTHSEKGVYYLAWLDFRLRIYNASRRDSGRYQFEVAGTDGEIDQHNVFVDIAPLFFPPIPAAAEVASNSHWGYSSSKIRRPYGVKRLEFSEPSWLPVVENTKKQRKHRRKKSEKTPE